MGDEMGSVHWARQLKVRHLECFLLLEESGTLSEAASRMHMTQSAMSHWLRDLEELARTRLVTRGRKIELTASGLALKRLAVRVLGDVARTHEELGVIATGAARSIHVGSVTAGIGHIIPSAIARYQQERPEVLVKVSEGALNTLLEGLERRELDLVVGSVDTRAYGPSLFQQFLFDDEFAIVTGTQHPLAQRARVYWADLFEYPWIMPPAGTLMRTRLETMLLDRGGASIRPKVETASIIVIQSLLRQTDYVGVWSGSLADHLGEVGLVHVLGLRDFFGPVGAVWRTGDRQPDVEQFLLYLREAAEHKHGRSHGAHLRQAV